MSAIKVVDVEENLPLLCVADVPLEVLRSDFGYLLERYEAGQQDPYQPLLVLYHSTLYDVHDVQTIVVSREHTKPVGHAMYVEPGSPFAAWHGVAGDSWWSGILFRINQDDTVTVGRYTC